jgi:putative membrane protein
MNKLKRMNTWTIVVIAVLVMMSGRASADGDDGHDMMDNWGGFPFFGGMFMMMGLWLIFFFIGALVYMDAQDRGMNGLLWFILVIIPWVGIIFLILYVVMRDNYPSHDMRRRSARPVRPPRESAAALLDRRYARGDVTREEYLRMKEDMRR